MGSGQFGWRIGGKSWPAGTGLGKDSLVFYTRKGIVLGRHWILGAVSWREDELVKG